MLKLERTSQLSGLTVRLRERERFFEPRLLKALAIALLFHCSALLFFNITPFTFSSAFTFPPVQVQFDQPSKSISTLVSAYVEESDELLPPPLTLIPALDWISLPQQSTLTASAPLDPQALQPLEERLWPKWQEPLSPHLEEPRIQLTISGDLAELPLAVSDPLLNQMQPLSSSSPAYVTYQVQMDEKTGELFWYERIQSSGIVAIDHLTEKILLNLRFSPKSQEMITGTLSFAVLQSIDVN